MSLAVLRRSHSAQFPEHLDEVALVEETALGRNLLDCKRSLREELSRMVYAYGRNVLSGRDRKQLCEDAAECRGSHARSRGER